MRKLPALLAGAVALLMVPLVVAGIANAANFRSGGSPNVAKGEVIDSTLFIAGQTVDVAGEINGDLYCAGATVTVSGTVHGDVLCAGQTVSVRGTVDGDVRVAGQTVMVEAKTDGNVSMAGSMLTFASDASARDVHGAGAMVALNGSVLRDADVAGDQLNINGRIGRNVQAAGENVTLGSQATVTGNLEYTSYNTLSRDKDAMVSGTTRQHVPKDSASKRDSFKAFSTGFQVFVAVATFVTSLILIALLPRLFYSVSERGIQQPLLSGLSGLGVSVGGIVVVLLLAFTVIAMPLAFIALLVWLLLLILSIPVFSFYLGRMLFSSRTNNVVYYMLAGAAIILVVSLIPVVGGLVMLVGSWFGVGMLILELFRRWPRPNYVLQAKSRKK